MFGRVCVVFGRITMEYTQKDLQPGGGGGGEAILKSLPQTLAKPHPSTNTTEHVDSRKNSLIASATWNASLQPVTDFRLNFF